MASQIEEKVNQRIDDINNNSNVYDVGKVIEIRDFIVNVSGLNNVKFYEKVTIENKAFGYVNQINNNSVSVALLKIDSPINVGDVVESTGEIYNGQYSKESIGRIIDIFGVDKLTNKKFSNLIDVPIERKTIPIMDRTSVNRPLYTGITGIDLMYPIGKGQRQLIIGDKRTGKTQLCLDTIVNQKNNNVMCFYVAIGKTKKEVKTIYNELLKHGALDYTTIITAFNDELPPVLSLIPYFAASIAEDYMMEGYDVLLCIDDLKRHAEAYREISLISGKTPGRDAYPADIFYTHSRLLEKGCQYKNGGSITILPIVETKGSDITDYISTNIISITDGQIVLSTKNFQKGQKPAIDYGLSVSRLGGSVQESDMKILGTKTRQKLLSYLDTKYVYELVNMDDMTSELKNQFMEGEQIVKNLNQYKYKPKTKDEMINLFTNDTEVLDNTETSSDLSVSTIPVENNNNQVTTIENASLPTVEDNSQNIESIQIDNNSLDTAAYTIEQPVIEQGNMDQPEQIPVDNNMVVEDQAMSVEQPVIEQENTIQMDAIPVDNNVVVEDQAMSVEQPVIEQENTIQMDAIPVDNNIAVDQVMPVEQPIIGQDMVQPEQIVVDSNIPTDQVMPVEQPIIGQDMVQPEQIVVDSNIPTDQLMPVEQPIIGQDMVQPEQIVVDSNIPTDQLMPVEQPIIGQDMVQPEQIVVDSNLPTDQVMPVEQPIIGQDMVQPEQIPVDSNITYNVPVTETTSLEQQSSMVPTINTGAVQVNNIPGNLSNIETTANIS